MPATFQVPTTKGLPSSGHQLQPAGLCLIVQGGRSLLGHLKFLNVEVAAVLWVREEPETEMGMEGRQPRPCRIVAEDQLIPQDGSEGKIPRNNAGVAGCSDAVIGEKNVHRMPAL